VEPLTSSTGVGSQVPAQLRAIGAEWALARRSPDFALLGLGSVGSWP
jgi:hypothetical protein